VTRPWYVRDPAAFDKDRGEVEDAYPDLTFTHRGSDVVLRGHYSLHEAGWVLDQYLVEVEPDRAVRGGLPVVREIGGRIPQSEDRHVSHDGTACIALPDAFWFQYPKGLSLKEFLDGPMRGYFAVQSLISRGVSDAWEQGEWDHGEAGVLRFYQERFGNESPFVILRFLRLVATKAVRGHAPCPCGSGLRLRKCHGPVILDLRSRIPRCVAARSEERLSAVLREVGSQRPVRSYSKSIGR